MGKKETQNKRCLIILVVAVSVITVVLLSFLLRNTINKANYNERKEALHQLINTAARSINNNVETQWELAKVYENNIKAHLSEYDTVENFLQYLNSQMVNPEDFYFLVDNNGKYYCSDGVSGKIISTRYFIDSTEDELEYMDTLPHFKDGITYLILRTRLDKPIRIDSVNGEIEIQYCALVHNVSSLIEYVDTLFDSNNNTFVFDTDTGLMLYKHFGIRLLVDGYNVYEKYKKITLAYGENGNQIIDEIQKQNVNISLMTLDGEKFYLCSTPLNISNWSLLLVVEGSYFNNTSANAFGRIIMMIVVILSFTALMVIVLFRYFMKMQVNKQLLDNEQKVNAALKDAYQVKSNFLSYMSHDIRTPINGMIGMAKIGLNNSTDKDKVEECFKKIDLSSKHLLAIVNDVLDMSAIESGKIVISNEKMNIIGTLSSCLDIIKGSLNNRNLTVEEEYDCPTRSVLGDEFHLKQIVINILSNAVKFTEDGGTIKISCKQLEEKDGLIYYKIAISDTGCGMTEEFKKHIFEAFKTANPDGKTKYKGSGLGMAISHEYVRLMQGTITVDSKVNEGSTFTIVLPFGKLTEETSEVDLKKYNILLVDDNDINLEITQEMLEEQVGSIQIANNGKEALDIFTASELYHFNIILTDIQMPVMNGYEEAKAIRATDRKDNNVCIIALTANTYKDDIDAVFEAGMDGYLNKPFSVEQLLEKIGRGDIKS